MAILRRAQADVDRIFDWLARRSPLGAARWFAAFLQAVERVRHDPAARALAPESRDLAIEVRQQLFKTVRGRTYRLLFTIVGDEVQVLRVRAPGQAPVSREDLLQ